ncbi:hypothetical protein [Pueribacillus sp. YX66]|uniref:hypothetical protein n=1 Tax=Pueribacillus sp. YX66 TaxID=3229242 RepID=UPI00358D49AF
MEDQTDKLSIGQGLPPRSEFHQNRKKERKNTHLYLTKLMFYLFLFFIGFVFIYYLSF